MSTFSIRPQVTAPAGSKRLLAITERAYSFIPNLFGVFAESPSALKAYLKIGKMFDESSLSATER